PAKSWVRGAGLAATAMARGLAGTGGQPTVVFTPGPHPLEECAVQLAAFNGQPAVELRAELAASVDGLHLRVRQALADRPDQADLLLVVDQFEEVFTLCDHRARRKVGWASLSLIWGGFDLMDG